MDTVDRLLDKVKQTRSLPTDMALAAFLHVGRAAVSRWRTGLHQPDEVTCARIAEATGEPLARVLGIVGEARAKSSAAKAVWRQLAAAACLVLALSQAAPSQAHQRVFSGLKYTLCEVLRRLRFRLGAVGWPTA